MADRVTTYAGSLPSAKDILRNGQFFMHALGKLAATCLGENHVVDGFTCTATAPASLNVRLGPGVVYQLANLEATPWSSLTADITHSIVKQGILLDAGVVAITPPATIGHSQVYLIQVQYQDEDGDLAVLNYYNAGNPASPFYGPPVNGTGSGNAQSTTRKGIAKYQIKAGVSVPTGTQQVPAPDAGWVGLFAITVATGQTSITAGNIAQLSSAPFVLSKLPRVPYDVQNGQWIFGDDLGTANQLAVYLNPAPATLTKGLGLRVKVAVTNTGAATLNVNQLGPVPIKRQDLSDVGAGELIAGAMVTLAYDGQFFQVQSGNPIADTIFISQNMTIATPQAAFPALHDVMAWLRRKRIINGAIVTVAPTGTHQVNTTTGSLILEHPDSQSIEIVGDVIVGNFPVKSDIDNPSVSSVRSTLYGKFPTRLKVTGAVNGLYLRSQFKRIARLLIDGDQTAGQNGLIAGDWKTSIGLGAARLEQVFTFACGEDGTAALAASVFSCSYVGSSHNLKQGFRSSKGASIVWNEYVIAMRNGQAGGLATNLGYLEVADGVGIFSKNGQHGLSAFLKSEINFGSATSLDISGNGVGGVTGYGISCVLQSLVQGTQGGVIQPVTGGGNFGNQDIVCSDQSYVFQHQASSMTPALTTSPALNTLGNHQAYIRG